MSEMETEDLIRYDILTQDALRGVISRVLEEVALAGLPGDHHFFITFETNHPGVQLSPRMRERYPEEMTIVIQHTFWNLVINETWFEIDLSFDDIRERLRIPFASIKGFYDPSVKFGLQFEVHIEDSENETEENDEQDMNIAPLEGTTRSKSGKPQDKAEDKQKDPGEGESSKTDNANEPDEADSSSADVVSLDSFRKKNK